MGGVWWWGAPWWVVCVCEQGWGVVYVATCYNSYQSLESICHLMRGLISGVGSHYIKWVIIRNNGGNFNFFLLKEVHLIH